LPAQPRPINFRVGVNGGVNMAEDGPLYGVYASVQGCNIVVQADVGWTRLGFPDEDFIYINPALGFYLGERVRWYGLLGFTNWGGQNVENGRFEKDRIWFNVKLGLDIPITRHLFLNFNWTYLIDSNRQDIIPYKNNAICLSMGFWF